MFTTEPPFGRRGRTAALLIAAVSLGDAATAPANPQNATREGAPTGHVVVVELFTSQGCSTCPPADRLLTSLGEQETGRIVPLAFHVDYWNSAGWKDPFSKADWSKRQTSYARAFGLRNIYTPEAVVDGGAEVLGSDASALRAAIAAAAGRPAGQVALQIQPAGSELRLGVDVDLPEALRAGELELMLAVFETGLVTQVGRGENGGRELHNDYVVRSLSRAGVLKAGGPSRTRHSASVALDPGWNRARLGIAAFLQDPRSLAIRGADARALASPAP